MCLVYKGKLKKKGISWLIKIELHVREAIQVEKHTMLVAFSLSEYQESSH